LDWYLDSSIPQQSKLNEMPKIEEVPSETEIGFW